MVQRSKVQSLLVESELSEDDAPKLLRIGVSRDVSQLPLVQSALRSSCARVRSSAAWALGFFEDPESTELLFDSLEDIDFQVRSSAGWGLVRRGPSLLPRLRRCARRSQGDELEMLDLIIERLEQPAPHGLMVLGARRRAASCPKPSLKPEAMSEANFMTAVHDLRNLSTSVGFAADLLADGDPEASPQEVADLASTLQSISRGLLDSCSPALKNVPEAVRLDTFVDQTFALAAPILRSYGLDCHLEVAPNTEGTFDPGLLQRALLNLIWNAAKHASGATAVWITAESSAEYLWLHVEDDGPGIPKGRSEALSEAFARGEGTAQEGWGLGLYLVRTVTEALGGQLQIGDSSHGGALFSLGLPVFSPSI